MYRREEEPTKATTRAEPMRHGRLGWTGGGEVSESIEIT